MLFNLSFKNFKKSLKNYAIYFFTLILGVSVFYVFNAIETQSAMMAVSNNTKEIIKLLTSMISGLSVFIAVVLGFLVIYASNFLIKRRKKEFGIYMTLGMSKGKISKLLLIETIIIGCFSLAMGLLIGIGLSQIMSVIVANMFEADMTKYTFVFSSDAMFKTILYFGIMYLLVMIFNTISVGRCKLIDLISAIKKNEKVKIKKTWICIILFLVSVGLLGYAYYDITVNTVELDGAKLIVDIVLGSLGTFLLFWSVSGFLLKVIRSRKKSYYKNLNPFILKQIDSKVNTTVVSMTVISLLLFLTIGALSTAISLSRSATKELEYLVPADFQATKPIDSDKDTTKEVLLKKNIEFKYTFKKYVEVETYTYEKFTLEQSFDAISLSELKKQYPMIKLDGAEKIMAIDDYNKLAKFYGHKQYSLKDNEYMVIADFENMVEIRNKGLERGNIISLNDKKYSPKYNECKEGFITIGGNRDNEGVILVPDSAISSEMDKMSVFTGVYKSEEKEKAAKIDAALLEKLSGEGGTTLSYNTKIDIYEASIGLGALVTFIGMYLGITFLICSTAILALKELSESTDNKNRYNTLRQLGVDNKMINKALFAQIAIFFILPLLVAIVHSIFGIKFVNTMLLVFGDKQVLPSIIITAIIIIVIYGGYFLITYACSKNIINERE